MRTRRLALVAAMAALAVSGCAENGAAGPVSVSASAPAPVTPSASGSADPAAAAALADAAAKLGTESFKMTVTSGDGFRLTSLIDVVFVFFLLALFDSVGTLVGLASRIGILRPDGTLPRARQALLSDAIGTVVGAGLGTSTVTAYIESSTGVAAGGRTGLAAVVTATLFLLALFFYPLVGMVGSGYATASGARLYPMVAPALVLVGVLMMEGVRRIKWDDLTEAIPAFLALITMPLAFSITDGIAFGFIAYAILKPATGRARELHWLAYALAAVFVIRYWVG